MNSEPTLAPPHHRIRPWIALRSWARAVRDPDDTEAGVRFVLALSGNTGERLYQRFRRDSRGARILAEGTSLLDVLRDRERLRALPSGSLGHAYLAFLDRGNLSADGLADTVDKADHDSLAGLDPQRRLVRDRIRDMHDLWHVVTGYERDLLGEVGLVAFTWAQLRTPAFAWILTASFLVGELRLPGVRRMIRNGLGRGRAAPWLPVQDWETLLELPLREVRALLCVGEPPHYERVWSAGAPESAH